MPGKLGVDWLHGFETLVMFSGELFCIKISEAFNEVNEKRKLPLPYYSGGKMLSM